MGRFLAKLDAGYFHIERGLVVAALVIMAVTVFLDTVHRRLVAPDSAITSLVVWLQSRTMRDEIERSLHGTDREARLEQEMNKRLAGQRKWLNRYLSPVVLGLLTYLVVLLALRTTQRKRSPEGALTRLPRDGTLMVLGFCLVVGVVTSHTSGAWAWLMLIIAGGIGAVLGRVGRNETRVLWNAAAFTAIMVLLAWLMVRVHSRWTFAVLIAAVTVGVCLTEKVRGRRSTLIGVAVGGAVGCLLALRLVPAGFSWAKEVAMLLLLWVGFLGTSMASYARRHIMVDFCRKLVPERGRKYYEGVSALIAAGFCVLLGYLGYLYVFGAPAPMSIYSMNAHLEYTRLPSWIAVAAIPLGLATSALRFLGVAVQAFRNKLATVEEGHR